MTRGALPIICRTGSALRYNLKVSTHTAIFLMADTSPTEYFIQGITSSGRKFRPSDWSERLAGVMACYGPKSRGTKGPNSHLQYSLYVRPTMIGDLKCVILDSRLHDIEPMAFNFVMNFARDNDLIVTQACELNLEPPGPAPADPKQK